MKSKLKSQKSKFCEGFTLIEILVSVGILLTVGAVLTGVLVSSLRVQSRTDIINSVRQNGNNAIAQMSKILRNSLQFSGVSTDGSLYSSNCTVTSTGPVTPTPTPAQYKYVRAISFDGSQTVFSCDTVVVDGSPILRIASNGASLIDENRIKVDSCSFQCSQKSASDVTIIDIIFSLSQKSSGALFENTATIPFRTSVQLRNTGR